MQRQRFECLDGVRGLAALSVVIFHAFSAYAPQLISEQTSTPWWGSDTPLAVLYSGGFAVSVFFVLSGFVISNSAAQRKSPLVFTLAQRYLRLAVPVLASTILAWTLLALWPGAVAQMRAADPHVWLNWTYDGAAPGLLSAIHSALFTVFLQGGSLFNNVLWTMKIELLGSIAIYLLYGLVKPQLRTAVLLLAAMAAIFLQRPEYAAFAVGALMREAVAAGRLPSRFAWGALVFGLIVGAMSKGYATRLGLPLQHGQFALGEPHKVWHVVASGAVIYAVLGLPTLRRFLSSAPLRFLGGISFGLYLVHVPLLYTVFAPLYLMARTSPAGLTALVVTFVGVAGLAGYVFTVLVDRPTIGVIRQAMLHVQRRRPTAGLAA